MFIGHFAPALAARTLKDAPRLPALFIASQFVDWLFFGFILIGIEHVRIVPGFTEVSPFDLYDMPYTHSLAASIFWAAVFAFALERWTGNRKAAVISAAVVLSHWFLDLLVHVPDLTLAGAAPKLGFGLWRSGLIERPLEIGITLAALWLYARNTGGWRPPVVILGAVLLVLQGVDWFGAKPEMPDASLSLLGWSAYGAATFAAWWADRGARDGRAA